MKSGTGSPDWTWWFVFTCFWMLMVMLLLNALCCRKEWISSTKKTLWTFQLWDSEELHDRFYTYESLYHNELKERDFKGRMGIWSIRWIIVVELIHRPKLIASFSSDNWDTFSLLVILINIFINLIYSIMIRTSSYTWALIMVHNVFNSCTSLGDQTCPSFRTFRHTS